MPLLELPPLIYGTAWKREKTAELTEQAVLCGFRGIDTACQPKHYHEAGVGRALQRLKEQGIPRTSLFLQTKYTPLSGHDPFNIPYTPSLPIAGQVEQSVQASLKNLNTEYLDAVLLHSPLSTHAQTLEAWQVLEKLHQQGVIHRIGVSNCYELSTLKLIFNETEVKPSILQNRFYAQTGYDKEIRSWCSEKNITYQSFWTLTANPHILHHPILAHTAAKWHTTAEQLFFRFLTQQQIVPLIGTCAEKHMREDLAIFDFKLAESEMNQINCLLE